ncbi:uncharacterized protein LOC141900763 [Tubulanus polymorphus]|uniref:uncharacterized protein LOC141900762 n=1 Tax=Tubulanus polymorphus TaxID=672921 RepID=UPI003DA56C42
MTSMVEDHIKSFEPTESHCGRTSTNKKYLPSHLNVVELYKGFLRQAHPPANHRPITLCIYRKIFNKMNLSFRSPWTDTCPTCDLINNKKVATDDGQTKIKLEEQLSEHHAKAALAMDTMKADMLKSRQFFERV